MYHICRSKSKTQPFRVVLVGKNGEPLSTSEIFKSKQAAWRNIVAQLKVTDNIFSYAQDDTAAKQIVYKIFVTGTKVKTDDEPKPKYIAGKNPKRK